MFGLFKKKPKLAAEKYYVYRSQVAKYRQFIQELSKITEVKEVVLICFFEDNYNETRKLLQAANISYSEDNIADGVKVSVSKYSSNLLPRIGNEKQIILTELYPARSVIEELLGNISTQNPVICFVALDSPFFEAIGHNRTVDLMDKLGLEENERIEHSLVSKAIIRTQQKLQSKVGVEKPARSMEEWVKINL